MASPGMLMSNVRPGDSIRAEDWNAVRRRAAALSIVGGDVRGLATATGNFVSRPPRRMRQPDVVLVRNDTGTLISADRPVLALRSPIVAPEVSATIVHAMQVGFAGETPVEDQDEGLFGVLFGPVAEGQDQLAIVSGMSWVRLSIEDADHEYADIEDGNNTRLKTASSGSARIFWKESSGDERWGIVRLSRRAA